MLYGDTKKPNLLNNLSYIPQSVSYRKYMLSHKYKVSSLGIHGAIVWPILGISLTASGSSRVYPASCSCIEEGKVMAAGTQESPIHIRWSAGLLKITGFCWPQSSVHDLCMRGGTGTSMRSHWASGRQLWDMRVTNVEKVLQIYSRS